jgi:hypothetical protein
VAAATTAAEHGLDVAVIERYGFSGGAAVAGLSGTICGLFAGEDSPTPESAVQLVHGFADRFRTSLADLGGVTAPQVYGHTHAVTHDPHVWREAGDALLTGAGVRIFFHTQVVSAVMDGDTFRGAVVTSKAGLAVVRATRIIDASGDSVMVSRAGYRTVVGDNGSVQNPTMIFRLGNADVDAFTDFWGPDTISPDHVTDLITAAEASGRFDLPRKKIWIFPTTRTGELMVNATRISGDDGRELNPLDPADFTEAEIRGRKQVREYARFLAEFVPGCADTFLADTGVEAGIRQTRSIAGVETLRNDDVVGTRKRADGIARSAWPIELHSGDRPKLHWLVDDYYEIPYLTLVPEAGENLIVAGRCLSAEHEALASARVTAQCFEMGQAAALATVASLESGIPYRDIPGEAVRERMVSLGSTL